MPTINIQQFCLNPNDAEYINARIVRPFVVGGWQYGTDGKIIVRIPTTESDTLPPVIISAFEGPKFRPESVFDRYFDPALGADNASFLPWPSDVLIVRKVLPCPNSQKDKFNVTVCLRYCPLCHGDAEFEQDHRCMVGEHWIAAKYHSLIDTLPDVKYIDVPAKNERGDFVPLPFIFDGGQGLICGLNPGYV